MTFKISVTLSAFISLAMILAVSTAQAQSDNPQEQLRQYISDLQRNPGDTALREKIIKYVQTMKPALAIPEEARRYFIEGNALLKAAKDRKGYGLAIDAYRQCLLIAPWWAEALYNYAVALDLANQFDEGMNALKLYIATNPGGEESRKAQDKIYEIGAKKKLAAQEKEESSPQAVAAREQSKFEDLLRKIDGRRYTCPGNGGVSVIDVRGTVLVLGGILSPEGYREGAENSRIEIRDRETRVVAYSRVFSRKTDNTYIISEDGDKITVRTRFSDGDVRESIYLWQK